MEIEINLHINEENLVRTGSNKYLGVQIDSEIELREHATSAKGRISRAMGMLKYAKKYLLLETVKNIYASSWTAVQKLLLSVALLWRNPARLAAKASIHIQFWD